MENLIVGYFVIQFVLFMVAAFLYKKLFKAKYALEIKNGTSDEADFDKYLVKNVNLFVSFVAGTFIILIPGYPIIAIVALLQNIVSIKSKTKEKKIIKKAIKIAPSEGLNKKSYENAPSKGSVWNNVYKCNSCNMYSRYYQSAYGVNLEFLNCCPFCNSEESLEEMPEISKDKAQEIPFADRIDNVGKHIYETHLKWLNLEEKRLEFESMKTQTKIKLDQLRAYEKLKNEDLTEKITMYEKKLLEYSEEMENFRNTLADDLENMTK